MKEILEQKVRDAEQSLIDYFEADVKKWAAIRTRNVTIYEGDSVTRWTPTPEEKKQLNHKRKMRRKG